jgi:predicted RNA-binding Zn ribbon-like protein/succinyl-CoA synthetase alpha subunit
MLEAHSVAVVGASARAGSFGQQLLFRLLRGGYQGTVHPVNLRYPEVLGLPCRPSLAELPGPVDLAVLAVPNHALEAELQAAADAAIPAAVIFASCAPKGLAERLRAIAKAAGMAVCGGNGMGFFNLEQRLRVCGYPEPEDLPCGPVAVVSHSGSVFSALLHNRRGLRFNLVVSCGMELVTSAAAYLDHALELESTRVVALFLETVREPAAFRAALAKAADRGVQVVTLKVGRSRAGGAMVAAHSGALAGEDGAYQALFDAYGVARVDTLDELADTCELELQRDGTTADLLADQDGLARWLHGTGGPDTVGSRQLQALREQVRALLDAAVQQRILPPAAVTVVNRTAAAAPTVARLEADELVIRYHASPPDAFLADIATSAIALVGGPGRDRLRRCGAPGCGRWFLASRPRQRWCSPSCGNRARLARFQQRRRAA